MRWNRELIFQLLSTIAESFDQDSASVPFSVPFRVHFRAPTTSVSIIVVMSLRDFGRTGKRLSIGDDICCRSFKNFHLLPDTQHLLVGEVGPRVDHLRTLRRQLPYGVSFRQSRGNSV
jgi:hypothetical protein